MSPCPPAAAIDKVVSERGADQCPPHPARLTSFRLPSSREPRRRPWRRQREQPSHRRLRASGSRTFGRSSSAFGRRRGSDFGGRFRLFRTRRMDRDDHGIALGDRRDRHAFRQRQIGQMLRLVHLHLRKIELDELGQILRQAGDFHVGDAVRDHAALRLHARGSGFTLEVDRDVDADLLGLHARAACRRADGVARRMHLQILDDRSLLLVAHLRG